jgi:hypothetical protein
MMITNKPNNAHFTLFVENYMQATCFDHMWSHQVPSFIQCSIRTFTVKSKAVPLHAMEAHRVRGGIAPTHS